MSIPRLIKIKDASVEVFLIGPGYGEGVLVVIGERIVIGIDSCKNLVQGFRGQPPFLYRKVEELGDEAFLFWMLTHYHRDHYQEFDKVLKKYADRLTSIVVPEDLTEKDMQYTFAHGNIGITEQELAKSGYTALRDLLNRNEVKFKVTGGAGKHSWFSTILELPSGEQFPLDVTYYGPPKYIASQMAADAAHAVSQSGGSADSTSGANQGSYILHLRIGRFEALFLGDSEQDRTQQLLSALPPNQQGISCLKVAHHGAKDDTGPELLDFCSGALAAIPRYALIAPFKRFDHPHKDVISLLESRGYIVRKSSELDKRHSDIEAVLKDECAPMIEPDIKESCSVADGIVAERFSF